MGTMNDLTAAQVATELQVSEQTVARWARAGKFPGAFNLRGHAGWRIPREALNRFRNGGRRARPTAPSSQLSKRQQRERST